MKNGHFRTDHLPFSVLAFDPAYQRQHIASRVKKLGQNWKDSAVGAITVSIRDDSKAYVIDGQHRVRAAMENGRGAQKVLCHVYTGLTLEQEAQKFLELNDVRAVSPIDRYRAGIAAKDPLFIGIRDILAEHGLHIGGGTANATVRCVNKAVSLYERDPELLRQVCAVLTGAWGTRGSAFEQIVFTAVGQIVGRYNGELDRAKLVKKLSGYRGGPAALIGDARGLSDYRPACSVTRAAAEIIVETYNRGARTAALPPL